MGAQDLTLGEVGIGDLGKIGKRESGVTSYILSWISGSVYSEYKWGRFFYEKTIDTRLCVVYFVLMI